MSEVTLVARSFVSERGLKQECEMSIGSELMSLAHS